MAKDQAFQAAEEKIAEALRSGATELNLSGLLSDKDSEKLTELPESLGSLTQLESLNLSYNRLTALPDSLGSLTQLKSLDLSNNQLSALPEWLGQLTALQSLEIRYNQLTALPDWLGSLSALQTLDLSGNRLTALPESLGQLCALRRLWIGGNNVTDLPRTIAQLTQLSDLALGGNPFREWPEWLGYFTNLHTLWIGFAGTETRLKELPYWVSSLRELKHLAIGFTPIHTLPKWVGQLSELQTLQLKEIDISDIPSSLAGLTHLERIDLEGNPLNPELAAAYAEGLAAVKRYLRAKAEAQVVLNEAKLILVGEGEVGKSCLLGALRGDEWEEGKPTTHGIEIKPVQVADPATGTEITLNGWDFGGQRVYRPTHQLFFTAPAVYLVVWKPREGPQQGFVKEWIKLVKHREPDAKILVVATHGGPKERQPDIDRQEIWDLFGKETVVDFFLVQSKPDPATNERHGIAELREAIARVAAGLPEMGRTFPQHWQEARTTLRGLLSLDAVLPLLEPLVSDAEQARGRLQRLGENRLCLERAIAELGELVLDEQQARAELSKARVAYLPLARVFALCKEHQVEEEDARLLLRIGRAVGDLIHFERDSTLRDIVILKPDWLATAMSFVLDDEHTRKVGHGLVSFERLGQLWNNPDKPAEDRYPAELHPIFLRLMERFDLCYRITEAGRTEPDGTSLIAQLVPDVRPDPVPGWADSPIGGDAQQVQVCRIVDATKNESATTEGLFFQLIVRLHKYSLGRADYAKSVHWQRGLLLEDDTGARAFLEHIGSDVRITVRSPYPERFLSALTYDVKWLVEYFWKGVRCEVTVPCLTTGSDDQRCNGLFNVNDLIEDLRDGRPEQKCNVCKKWLKIAHLLGNAPEARPNPMNELLANYSEMKGTLESVLTRIGSQHAEVIGRFDDVDAAGRETVSKLELAYTGLMHTLLDEAKEGPRLFSFEPVEPRFVDKPKWMSAKFKLTLWCEHARRPLWSLAGDSGVGVYTIELPREWLVKAAPFLKTLSTTLGLLLPVVAAEAKVALPSNDYKSIEAQLLLGKSSAESLLKGGEKAGEWLAKDDGLELAPGSAIRAEGAVLRQLHAWLKEKDPTFGGLVRVQNKRQEFLWVHPQFEDQY
jgi:hypothetical protein